MKKLNVILLATVATLLASCSPTSSSSSSSSSTSTIQPTSSSVISSSSTISSNSSSSSSSKHSSSSSTSSATSSSSTTSSSGTDVISITSIEIGNYPDKTEYNIGEELDITGLTILVNYSDGSQKEVPVTLDMVIAPSMNKEGQIDVIIKYEEKYQAYYTINIKSTIEKEKPTITFTLDDGTTFTNGTTLLTNDLKTIIVSVNAVVDYEIFYTKDDGETNLGSKAPTEPGLYAINVTTLENAYYSSTTAFVWYYIKAPSVKKEAEISFSIENGTKFTQGEPYNIEVTVSSGADYEVYYTKDDGEIDLGATAPTEPGLYAVNVRIIENDEFVAPLDNKKTWRWFEIVAKTEKQDAEISFSVASGTHFTYGEDYQIEVAVSNGADYEVYYTKDDGETNLGQNKPTEPGTYAINVAVKENALFNSSRAFVWYVIDPAVEKQDAEVTFSMERGTHLAYGQDYSIQITVSEGADYEWFYTKDDGETNLGQNKPTAPGTYAINVAVKENATFKAKNVFVWYVIDSPSELQEAVIEISIENGTIFTYGTPYEITVKVSDGADYEVYYTKDDGETNLGTTAPTEPGVYAINVLVKENNIYKSSSAFRWYRINENEAQSLKKVLPQ